MTIRNRGRSAVVALALATASLLGGASIAAAQEVNVYTSREPGLAQPLFDAFTAETGIRVNTVFIQQGLAERVEAEGAASPADLLMVVDYGALIDLVDRGLTQGITSPVLDEAVPANLRDPDGHWFGLSMRARVAYVSPDLDITAITYEELANPEWEGRVCIRSGQHPYNTSLFAAFIAKHGEEATREYLTGLHANLARPAAGGDRDGARDIMAGICDIAIANSYYVGLMRSGAGGAEQQAWGNAIRVIFPTFADGLGTHVNISGAALAAHAPNLDNARLLLEFLVSEEAQEIYAKANFEYPVRPGVPADPIIAALGTLVIDPTPLVELSTFRQAASRLVDAVGFDN
ncbi:MAG: extracellular solute-binding protein [Bauldia sp.]|nr:extracellular solute-binding protein [Bauldia sp.]